MLAKQNAPKDRLRLSASEPGGIDAPVPPQLLPSLLLLLLLLVPTISRCDCADAANCPQGSPSPFGEGNQRV